MEDGSKNGTREGRRIEEPKEPREGTKRMDKRMDRRIAKPHGQAAKTSYNQYSYTLLGRPIIIFRKFRKTRP